MEDELRTPAWSDEYAGLLPTFESLAAEVEFALETTTGQRGIKTHSISSRVKTVESLGRKALQKETDDPLGEIEDVVGIRVVVLFLSDLPRLNQLINETFNVHEYDNKVTSGDPASFGYMSVHYVATLSESHSGPRYDAIKGMRFEIQTRTVVMDAWANVSHYLDYRGESSVPEELRKDFFALSGLFYVADQHFEIFADQAQESSEHALQQLDSAHGDDLELNLDTLAAYLSKRYPERVTSDRAAISEMVEELTEHGYVHLRELTKQLDAAKNIFDKYERDQLKKPSDTPYFTDLGAIRISLRLVDKQYAKLYPDNQSIKHLALWT